MNVFSFPATKPPSLAEALSAASETRSLEIGAGARSLAPGIFRQQFGEQPAVIVADANTWRAAGQEVLEAFRAARRPTIEPFIFRAPDLHAEHRFVTELEESFRAHRAIPVAVGSGTVNDLAKLASHRTGRRYMCVGTCLLYTSDAADE